MNDDKNLVIAALLAIAIMVAWMGELPGPTVNLLNNIISGLLGLAVGKGMQK